MKSKQGELGLSTLILATAMILIAGIVFMVLMETTNKVVTDTKAVGMAAKKNVGTGLYAMKLYAEDGTVSHSLNYFYFEIKLPYGSDEVKINESMLTFNMQNASQTYSFNQGIDCDVTPTSNTSAESIGNTTNAVYYGVKWLNGNAKFSNALSPGEVVRICFKSPTSLIKDGKITAVFQSKNGYEARVITSVDKLVTERYYYLFP